MEDKVNRFIDILNRIRQNVSPTWLTPSQQMAYNLLHERLNFLDEINLWGRPAVGKTFIGWVLQAQGLAAYASYLEEVSQEPALRRMIVLDNIGWQRAEVREALHYCRHQGYEKVVLITTAPVHDQISTVELTLTPDDVEKVAANLRSIGVAPYDDAPRNLWDLVSPISLK